MTTNGQRDARRGSKSPLRASPCGERQTVVLGRHPDHSVGQALGASINPIIGVAPFRLIVPLFIGGGAAGRAGTMLSTPPSFLVLRVFCVTMGNLSKPSSPFSFKLRRMCTDKKNH